MPAVDQLFSDWRGSFTGQPELPLSRKPYLLDDQGLTQGAGIIQINDCAREAENKALQADWSEIQELLKSAKKEFFELVTDKAGLDFGVPKKAASSATAAPEKAKVLA